MVKQAVPADFRMPALPTPDVDALRKKQEKTLAKRHAESTKVPSIRALQC